MAVACAAAETGIYRCTLDDGTVAFQEMPCAEPAEDEAPNTNTTESDGAAPAQDDFFDFVNPYDASQEVTSPPEPDLPEPVSADRDECIETTRNAIDAIDATLAEEAGLDEDSRAHIADLLELTRQLRACKAI